MKKTLLSLLLLSGLATAGQVLNRGNGAEPKSLDPQIAEGIPEANILMDLFEGLTAESASGELIPGLAEKWDVAEDGKTYTFHLRDAKWSDGSPVLASDLVYAWRRAVDPAVGSKYSFLLFPVLNAEEITTGKEKDLTKLGVEAPDDKTVVVKLKQPTPYFLNILTHQVSYPVPQKVVEKFGKDWTKPDNMASNGAFKLAKWVPNGSIALDKSDSYWDKDKVQLDQVVFYPLEDYNVELKRYQAGELDMTYELPNNQIKWLKENLPKEMHLNPWIGSYYYGFNLTKPPFKDNLNLRKALTLAIDRQVITDKITGAGEVPSYGYVPPFKDYPGYVPEYAQWDQKKRLEEAKKAYEEAGYSKDKPLKVELFYNTNDNHKKIAVAIASMWKQNLGVETELVNQEWKVFLNRRQNKETQVFRAGWIADYNDPYSFLELYGKASGQNDVGLDDAKYNELLEQASGEADPKKRFEQLAAAEKILVDDFAVMPIYTYVAKQLVKPYVKGFENNILNRHPSRFISIEKK